MADARSDSKKMELIRSRFLFIGELRNALKRQGYLEVDTAQLRPVVGTDPFVSPVGVEVNFHGRKRTWYLHTSPEFEMKRLVALGLDSIFSISHVFRAGDYSSIHNPEFCMAEWYRSGWNYRQLMDELEQILADVFRPGPHRPASIDWPSKCARVTIDNLFQSTVGFTISDLQAEGALWEAARRRELIAEDAPRDFSKVFTWLWVKHVDRYLAEQGAVFLIDWPVALAELAQVNPQNRLLAERFELIYRGIELANGYQELTDPAACLERFEHDVEVRTRECLERLPVPSSYVAEVCRSLPMSAGLSLGVDRLAMLACGVDDMHDVLSWSYRSIER